MPDPECEIGRRSWEPVTVLVLSSLIQYSSAELRKNALFPDLFRNSLVFILPFAGSALRLRVDPPRWPPSLPPRRGSLLAIREALDRVLCEGSHLAQIPSGYSQTDYSSSVSISQGWDYSVERKQDRRIPPAGRTAGPCSRSHPDVPRAPGSKYHILLRVIFPDLLAPLHQFVRHERHLRLQVRVIHSSLIELPLGLFHLLPIRPLSDILDNVSGPASSERLAGSPRAVLQTVKLCMELHQLVVDALEGGIRNLQAGRIHVLPNGIPAGSGLRLRWLLMKGRRGWRKSPQVPRRGGWDDRVAGRAGFRSSFRYLVGDLFHCYGQPHLFFRLDAVIMFVEVEDEREEVRGFSPDVGDGPSNNLVDEQSPIHRPDS